MKLLITGFEPFGGAKVNPSWEAVQALEDRIGPWELEKLLLPTVFGTAAERAIKKAEETGAKAVLCVGQAGGRSAVTPEMAALNLRYASIPDNGGNAPRDEPVVPGGPAAYFSTLPVRKMAQAISQTGLNGTVSYSAGVYVCNDLMYTLLHRFAASTVRVGFIHVPYLPEQGQPSMPLPYIARALAAAILAIEIE